MSGRNLVSCVGILLSVVSVAILDAQKPVKGGSAPATYPVTAEFRCPAGADCMAEDRTDRVRGDGAPYAGVQNGTGVAYFNSNYDFQMQLQSGFGRHLWLDFTQPNGSAPCAAAGTCRKNFSAVQTFSIAPPLQINPVDAAATPIANGFYGIPVGQSSRAHFKLSFPDPSGRAIFWTIRFNPNMFPGTTGLTVTRLSENVWEAEAGTADVAQLLSTPTKGKAVDVNEGFYTLPFKITITR